MNELKLAIALRFLTQKTLSLLSPTEVTVVSFLFILLLLPLVPGGWTAAVVAEDATAEADEGWALVTLKTTTS